MRIIIYYCTIILNSYDERKYFPKLEADFGSKKLLNETFGPVFLPEKVITE